MAFGEVQWTTDYEYRVRVQHNSSGAMFNAVLETDLLPESAYDAGLQALVDLLDAAPGWTVHAASKRYDGWSVVTPTT